MIGGERALFRGYCDVDKGWAFAMRGDGARVFVTEIDQIGLREQAGSQSFMARR